MENYKSYAELKRLARMQMGGRTGVLIGAMVLSNLITYAASYIVAAIIPTSSPVMYVLNYVVTFMVQLISAVLQTGLCLLHLHAACNMECRISDLFYAFKNNPDKSIKIGAVLAVIQAICMIPCDIMQRDLVLIDYLELNDTKQLMAAYSAVTSFYAVVMLCMLVYFVVTLAFFPVYYMVLDFPNLSAGEILRKSVAVMKGNKVRYFLLVASFLPIILLSSITCGIALLWVMPYMSMTSTNFYLDLISRRRD